MCVCIWERERGEERKNRSRSKKKEEAYNNKTNGAIIKQRVLNSSKRTSRALNLSSYRSFFERLNESPFLGDEISLLEEVISNNITNT